MLAMAPPDAKILYTYAIIEVRTSMQVIFEVRTPKSLAEEAAKT